jgi:hypothetical protein
MSQELPFESLCAVGSNALRWYHRLERLGPDQVRVRRRDPSVLNVPAAFIDEWMEYRRARDARERRTRVAFAAGLAGMVICGALAIGFAPF